MGLYPVFLQHFGRIHKMSQSITIIPTDHVYMGMCLAKAGLATVSLVDVRALQEAQSEI